MNADSKKKFLEKTIRVLNDSLVVVEGKRDERALREIGLTAKIIRAEGKPERIVRKTLEALAESNGCRVVLLLDFDEEGKRRARVLEEALFAEGMIANALLRKRVKQLFRVNAVEEIPFAYGKLLEEIACSKN